MSYSHEEYPKHLYHKSHTSAKQNIVVVNNEEEEAEAIAAGFQTKIPDPKAPKQKQQDQQKQDPSKQQ